MTTRQDEINNKVNTAADLITKATSEKIELAKRNLDDQKNKAVDYLNQTTEYAKNELQKGARIAKAKVEEEPIKSIAIIALISILIGFLLGRKK